MIRQPAVAGSFYPANQSELSALVDSMLQQESEVHITKGIIVPHAGYVYSGSVAGKVFGQTKIPKRVIIIGPNHSGVGANIAVSGADSWATPLGNIPISTNLRNELLAAISAAVIDDQAHRSEHSIEVMLPFLLKKQPELEILPISLSQLSLAACLQFGSAIAAIIKQQNNEVLLLASTDMNHFASAEQSKELDFMAINAMTSYDPQRLYQVVRENRISMCGVLPTITVMQAAHDLGATDCKLINYAHSGQVNGDNNRVVGYAGLVLN